MKCIFAIAVLLVAMMSILSCSSKNQTQANKVTSGPGDPKLTYDLVTQNVDGYIGKRVRWYGRQVSFESTGKPGGGENITRVVYMDVEKWQAGGDIQAFVVEYNSDLQAVMKLPSTGWVTGTVEGTQTAGLTLGSPSGHETRTPKTVPLLKYAEIETESSPK